MIDLLIKILALFYRRHANLCRANLFCSVFSSQQSLKESPSTVQISLGYIVDKSHYAEEGGAWIETSPKEIEKVITIISYCGLVNATSFAPKLEHKDFVPWVKVTKYNALRQIQDTYHIASWCQSR